MCERIGINAVEARDFISQFFEEISDCLERGESVKIAGLGSFTTRDKDARPGRNPKTGEVVEVTARRVVTFKVSDTILRQLRQ